MDNLSKLKPWLDTQDKFVAFINTKCASTSILVHLGDRVIRPNRAGYKDKIKNLSVTEVFKFAVIRNPFERIVSSFFFLKQCDYLKDLTFEDFILNELPKYDLTESVLETDREKIIIQRHCCFQYIRCNHEYIDFVARLDNIEQDWKFIASKIDTYPVLPHFRKSLHNKYTYYYTKRLIDAVSKIYSEDIRIFYN